MKLFILESANISKMIEHFSHQTNFEQTLSNIFDTWVFLIMINTKQR